MAKKPILLIHGGAGARALSAERADVYRESLVRILDEVYPSLVRGAHCVEAAAHAVELLENDPLYNAGKGSKIQSDGKIRMSASLMDGSRLRFSGCVNVEGVKNPIRLAHALLNENDRVLAENGARKFAKSVKLPLASPYTSAARAAHRAQLAGKTGTVGAVALDCDGRLAAATSTGGRGFEYPHRVSDSPTVAGNYANRWAAVSATGIGEEIVEHAVAASICTAVELGVSLLESARKMRKVALAHQAQFGFIALDRRGVFTALTSTETLIWAGATQDRLHLF